MRDDCTETNEKRAPSRKHPLYSINVIQIPLAIVENIDQ